MHTAKRPWVAAFLLLAMVFLSAIFAVQGALLSAMIDAYDLKAAEQGVASALSFAGGIAALVTAFFLQGRQRKRTLLKGAMLVCAAGLVLLWLAPGYGLYSAVWFVVGFGLGLMDTLLSACMADLYSGDAATRMMCLLHTAFGVASMLTPMGYAALLSGGMNWKRVYLVIALGGVALLAAAAVLRRVLKIVDTEPLQANTVSPASIASGLAGSRLALLAAAMLFHGLFLAGLNTWSNRYADTLPGDFAIPAQSCLFLGIMLSRLLFPFLPIKAGRYVRFAGLLGCVLLAAGLYLGNGLVLRVALALSGLTFGALIPCILSLGCDRQRGNTLLATTTMVLSLYVGQSFSSPMIAGLEAAFNLRTGMTLCVVCMALCSVCCWVDQSRYGKAE